MAAPATTLLTRLLLAARAEPPQGAPRQAPAVPEQALSGGDD